MEQHQYFALESFVHERLANDVHYATLRAVKSYYVTLVRYFCSITEPKDGKLNTNMLRSEIARRVLKSNREAFRWHTVYNYFATMESVNLVTLSPQGYVTLAIPSTFVKENQ